jgi:hypothetical protein
LEPLGRRVRNPAEHVNRRVVDGIGGTDEFSSASHHLRHSQGSTPRSAPIRSLRCRLIPGQRRTAVEYHFSNVTPNNGLPVGSLFDGDIAWRLSCPVQ